MIYERRSLEPDRGYFRPMHRPQSIVETQQDFQGQTSRYMRYGLTGLALLAAGFLGAEGWDRFQAPYRAQAIHGKLTTQEQTSKDPFRPAGSMGFDYSQSLGTSKASIVRRGDALQITYAPKGPASMFPLAPNKREITDFFPYGDADIVEDYDVQGNMARRRGAEVTSVDQSNYAAILAAASKEK